MTPDPPAACPPRDRLAAFARGDLPAAEIDRLAAHLEGCAACEAALDALEADGGTLAAAVGRAAAAAPGERAGTLLAGRYRLAEEIGAGGMGSVWRAEQTDPVRRPVAVKLVKPGMDSRQVLARFDAERQALAIMDHPNIAKVYDAGSAASGRPFFVMELVPGVPITEYCDARQLTTRERLALFVPVCQAVQHAHQKGVIHRDLKPGNVLVAEYDGRAVPKVIDFGVAKATGPALGTGTQATGLGVVVGTPEYMAPEQAAVDSIDVDTRADVYALGVVLYELLTGSTPLTRQRIGLAALLEVLRLVREEEPPPPSARLSTADALPSLAAQRRTEPRRLAAALRGDLDWVVMKCLEKDRGRRYDTADGLARDVERYLADEPVEAGRPSAGYRLRKFARRHRRPLAAAAAAAALLVAAAGVSTWQAVQATRAKAEAVAGEGRERAARETAEAVAGFMAEVFAQASAQGQAARAKGVTAEPTVRQAMDYAAGAIGGRFRDRPEVEGELRTAIGSAYTELGEYAKAAGQLDIAREARGRAFGPADRRTLEAAVNLALAYKKQRQLDKARDLLESTLDAMRRDLGPLDPYTLAAANNLGLLYQQLGRPADAERLIREALDGRRATLGVAHPDAALSLQNLGFFYKGQKRYAEAEPLLREALPHVRAAYGPDSPFLLDASTNLAFLLAETGRPAEAAPLFGEAADGYARGGNHAVAALSHIQCGLCLAAAGNFPAAEPHLLAGHDFLAARAAAMDAARRAASTRQVVEALARGYEAAGAAAKAAEWRAKLPAKAP